MHAERITDVILGHGEGPVWWPGWGGLRMVDGDAGDLVTLHDDGSVSRLHVDDTTGFVRPRTTGGYVVGGTHTIFISDTADGEPTPLVRVLDDPTVRLNDGGTDPQGRLYAGSMAYAGTPDAGVLLRVSGNPVEVETVFAPVTVSNGFAYSPDGSLAYYVDTATGRVDVCDVIDGDLRRRRPFVTIGNVAEARGGHPDGLTVAADGSVWVALWDGAGVLGFDADGALRERIDVPTPRTTACTFGGRDLDTLFITTSSQGMDPDGVAGSVFQANVGVTGMPALPYAW